MPISFFLAATCSALAVWLLARRFCRSHRQERKHATQEGQKRDLSLLAGGVTHHESETPDQPDSR